MGGVALERSEGCSCAFQEKSRNLAAFWLLGLINNASFVIMIAGAKNISEGGTAVVFIALGVPDLVMKITAPYWFHYISYSMRV